VEQEGQEDQELAVHQDQEDSEELLRLVHRLLLAEVLDGSLLILRL